MGVIGVVLSPVSRMCDGQRPAPTSYLQVYAVIARGGVAGPGVGGQPLLDHLEREHVLFLRGVCGYASASALMAEGQSYQHVGRGEEGRGIEDEGD